MGFTVWLTMITTAAFIIKRKTSGIAAAAIMVMGTDVLVYL